MLALMNSYCLTLILLVCDIRVIASSRSNTILQKGSKEIRKEKCLGTADVPSEPVAARREKRQTGAGAGKYTEAFEMTQTKLMIVFMQLLFKNLWDSQYLGGSHPLHPNVPKTAVRLYKKRIVDLFSPVGDNKVKQS